MGIVDRSNLHLEDRTEEFVVCSHAPKERDLNDIRRIRGRVSPNAKGSGKPIMEVTRGNEATERPAPGLSSSSKVSSRIETKEKIRLAVTSSTRNDPHIGARGFLRCLAQNDQWSRPEDNDGHSGSHMAGQPGL